MHNFFIKSITFLYMFRTLLCSSSGGLNCIYTASGTRFNKEIVHQVGKQDYILLRCTVNSTLKFALQNKQKKYIVTRPSKLNCIKTMQLSGSTQETDAV